jgi:hypothetical protein
MLRISEVSGSNLDPQIDYPEVFRGSLQFLLSGYYLKLSQDLLLPILQNSLFTNYSLIILIFAVAGSSVSWNKQTKTDFPPWT